MTNSTSRQPEDDSDREKEIQKMDEEAHLHFEVSQLYSSGAQMDGVIGQLWGDLGEEGPSKDAHDEELKALAAANKEREAVIDILIREHILKDAQSNEGIAKLRAAIPQLRVILATLHASVEASLPKTSDTRHRLENLYQQVNRQLAQSIGDHASSVALLENLELFFKEIQTEAHTNSSVRKAWLEQANTLSTIF